MRTRTIIAALLGFAQPMFAIDPSEPAIDQALATAATDAAAAPASDAGESNDGAPVAAGARESDTSSSAAPASLSSGTEATAGPQGDVTIVSSGAVTLEAPAVNVSADQTPAVSIDVEDHAEARERFAGLLAKLHGLEHEAAEYMRAELRAIGTLLHLHSVASGKADSTGDYSSSDLS
ncbi:hypothetical protein WK25_06050 [Burkholderia latens]|uniref:hypothetical protein n=1 Tax=Burkholderia latens TaxID=488446 RepID=UPI0008417363|nr:hypothetical protein [Burkholderia latens]AOK04068.1 hypothetical protein WK25_06050 [Burkholderia latens]